MKLDDRPRYYKRDGTPYPDTTENEAVYAWVRDAENPENQIVERTYINNILAWIIHERHYAT